jgi:mevalonate kinase
MNVEKGKEIFVPGRLCLFGEHSDWAGGHRRQNSSLEKGYAIIAPTTQGNFARVSKIEELKLIFKSHFLGLTLEVDLDEKKLLKIAEDDQNPLRYVAGVAHEVLVHYNGHKEGVRINGKRHGILIDNYKTDLPVKKGLSSSASICVLTAKAFKEIYDIPLSKRGVMNLAYEGELVTSSRCGRLDQACAYNVPVLMTFDGDRKMEPEELQTTKDLHFVIVDLGGEKNTQKILKELQKGFPFPGTGSEIKKARYLGSINRDIVSRAKEAILKGEAKKIGELMTEAQKRFDEYLTPACPEELLAPKLHKVLNMLEIQDLIYGGKGVGSQGEGTAQFISKNKESQERVIEILNTSGLNLNAIPLTIRS